MGAYGAITGVPAASLWRLPHLAMYLAEWIAAHILFLQSSHSASVISARHSTQVATIAGVHWTCRLQIKQNIFIAKPVARP